MARLASRDLVCDLVQHGVPDLLLASLQGMGAADPDHAAVTVSYRTVAEDVERFTVELSAPSGAHCFGQGILRLARHGRPTWR